MTFRWMIAAIVLRICEAVNGQVKYQEYNLTEISSDTLLNVYDFACGQSAFCNKSRSSYVKLDKNCIKCESCHCDDRCWIYGDCCADVALSHAAKNQPMTSTSCVNANPKECVSKPDFFAGGQFYRIVNRCPERYPNNSVHQKCQSDDLTDYNVSLPVTSLSSNLTYRNKFCAECHNVFDVTQWTAALYCSDPEPIRGLTTQTRIWRAVIASKSCCIASVSEPNHAYVRKCDKITDVSTCPNDIHSTELDRLLAKQCRSFSAEVYGVLEDKVYKNIFCAACNGVKIVRDDRDRCLTRDASTIFTASLGVLINFNPKPKPPKTPLDTPELACSNGEIFDPLLNRCRKLNCLPYKRFENDRCVNIYKSMKGLTYQLRYFLIPSRANNLLPEKLLESYAKNFAQVATMSNVVIVANVSALQTNVSTVGMKYLEVSMTLTSTIESTEDSFQKLVEKHLLSSWVDDAGVNYTNRHNFVCPTNLSIPGNMTTTNGIDQITHLSSKRIYRLTPIWWLSRQCHRNCFPSSVGAEYLSGSLRNKCPFVSYKTSDIVIDRETGFLSNGLQRLQVEGNEYEICGDEVYVCMTPLRERRGSYPVDRKDNDTDTSANKTTESGRGQRIASVVATTLSLVGLALTFVTYCLFNQLRTLPGINTMCLVAHLFLAQLIFQATSRTAAHDFAACAFFGILVHYLWLASFGWMAVIAYHMFNVFRKIRVNNDRHSVRSVLLYAAFANGTPILVIVACIAKNVAVTSREYIGYGSGLCFITSGIDVGIFMVAPLGVVIVINATFFGFTIRSIRATTAVIHASLNRDRHHIGIYIKLSVLLGFTWVFGLLAAALNVEALWYLFIVTSGCQGVYIFVAYCCTRRVLSLYKTRLCATRKDESSSTPIASVGTQSTSI